MNNLLGQNAKGVDSVRYYDRPLDQLINRLDAVLMVTKSCKQDACRNPWGVIFPEGDVTGLKQAMSSNYDTFFANQPKVSLIGDFSISDLVLTQIRFRSIHALPGTLNTQNIHSMSTYSPASKAYCFELDIHAWAIGRLEHVGKWTG